MLQKSQKHNRFRWRGYKNMETKGEEREDERKREREREREAIFCKTRGQKIATEKARKFSAVSEIDHGNGKLPFWIQNRCRYDDYDILFGGNNKSFLIMVLEDHCASGKSYLDGA